MWACTLIHLLIFAPAIPFGRDVGAAALGGSKMPRDQQKSPFPWEESRGLKPLEDPKYLAINSNLR